jgi:uncharacterized repeat protein (TIGR01451 family)
VTPSNPSIGVTKSPMEQTIERRATANWTITVTNTGNVTLTNVTVSDTDAPGCARTSATLPALASMAPNASVSYTCTLGKVSASFTNVAAATGTPPSGANPSANASAHVTVRVPPKPPTPKPAPTPRPVTHPSVTLEKSPTSQTVSFGGTATFRITVTNSGDVALTNVSVSDPRSPDCNRDLRTLAAGASRSYTCTSPNLRQSFVNTAGVAGAAASGTKVRDSASAPVRVSAPFVPSAHPAIGIVKGPNSQHTGYEETARFRVTVANTGNVRLLNVKVADPSSPGCNRSLGTLAAGASKTCRSRSGRAHAPPS